MMPDSASPAMPWICCRLVKAITDKDGAGLGTRDGRFGHPTERERFIMISEFRLQWPITRDLAALRECVHLFGVGAGLTGQRLEDLVFVARSRRPHLTGDRRW